MELTSENEKQEDRGRDFLVEGTEGAEVWRGRQEPYPKATGQGLEFYFKFSERHGVSFKQRSDMIQPRCAGMARHQAGVEAAARWAGGL